jgi:hypothetical protein
MRGALPFLGAPYRLLAMPLSFFTKSVHENVTWAVIKANLSLFFALTKGF